MRQNNRSSSPTQRMVKIKPFKCPNYDGANLSLYWSINTYIMNVIYIKPYNSNLYDGYLGHNQIENLGRRM